MQLVLQEWPEGCVSIKEGERPSAGAVREGCMEGGMGWAPACKRKSDVDSRLWGAEGLRQGWHKVRGQHNQFQVARAVKKADRMVAWGGGSLADSSQGGDL